MPIFGRYGSQPASARNVREDVCPDDDLFRHPGIGDAVIGAVRFVAINPAVSHVELTHDAIQIVYVMEQSALGSCFLGS